MKKRRLLKLAICGVMTMAMTGATFSGCSASGRVRARIFGNFAQISASDISITYSCKKGTFELKANGKELLGACYAEASADGTLYRAFEYETHTATVDDVTDDFGSGKVLTVVNRGEGKPDLVQYFYAYEELTSMMFRVELRGAVSLSSNYLAAIKTSGESGGSVNLPEKGKNTYFTSVPYDNDAFVSYYNNEVVGTDGAVLESSEVASIFNNETLEGVCFGSVEHDDFKSGISLTRATKGNLTDFCLYAGQTSRATRDTVYSATAKDNIETDANGNVIITAHGALVGQSVQSPLFYVGYDEDYRDGLESYAAACAVLSPPLEWTDGVIFGYNTWAAYGASVTYDGLIAASDYIADELTNYRGENGTTYMNFDSYWGSLTDEERTRAEAHFRENGQKIGAYWTPFAIWSEGDLANDAAGTERGDGTPYTLGEMALKYSDGTYVRYINGSYCLDASHPGTLQYFTAYMNTLVEQGYDYVKLDFLSNGSMEGEHFDESVRSGTQAYNMGMRCIAEALSATKIGRSFFISLSIAPIFPTQYAHARRISCDVFGNFGSTAYMLNSLSGGWWLSNTLYPYNDPDHAVLYQSFNMENPSTETEAKSRYNSAIISGTVMLASDQINATTKERLTPLLNNAKLNEVARLGKTFRPVFAPLWHCAAEVYSLSEGDTVYVAVFNTQEKTAEISFKLSDVGLKDGKRYTITNLNNGEVGECKGKFGVRLTAGDSYIYAITEE